MDLGDILKYRLEKMYNDTLIPKENLETIIDNNSLKTKLWQ